VNVVLFHIAFIRYVCQPIICSCQKLVAEHTVDVVVAMSHMRMPNDYKLAENCGGLVDILLGGHDHHYEDTVLNHIRILNSGTDFSDFSRIQIHGREDTPRDPNDNIVFTHPLKTTNLRNMIDNRSKDEDPEMVEALADIQSMMSGSMDVAIGRTKVDLDARFREIRTKETNISNFVASLMTRSTGADVAILNSGSLRADKIIPKGPITVRDMNDLLPMADPLQVIELTGDGLLAALENGRFGYLAAWLQRLPYDRSVISSKPPILFYQGSPSTQPWKGDFLVLMVYAFPMLLPSLRGVELSKD
jgi:5'-nucleotidase